MRINGTIHERNFDGELKWYFVEELTSDFFIGVMAPNDNYIKDKGKVIRKSEVKDWFKENLIVNGEPLWYVPDNDKPLIEDFTHINIEKGYLE